MNVGVENCVSCIDVTLCQVKTQVIVMSTFPALCRAEVRYVKREEVLCQLAGHNVTDRVRYVV